MNPTLTVVIPYFKKRFLNLALESLARQTSRNFEVFIGDDCSPENPMDLVADFQTRIAIRYHRFPSNLGGQSMAAQWNRCIAITKSDWVWLFSDDDLMSPTCIAEFHRTVAETGGRFDLYRFNTEWIDDDGKILRQSQVHPVEETAEHMALARFQDGRSIFAPEHIFRRSAFDRCGGFVDFPLAWFTDDATWVSFSKLTGIRTIENGMVSWRSGLFNLSSANRALVAKKLRAFEKYLTWLRREFPDAAFQDALRRSVWPWFNGLLVPWGGRPPFCEGVRFWIFFCRFTGRVNLPLARQLFF